MQKKRNNRTRSDQSEKKKKSAGLEEKHLLFISDFIQDEDKQVL
jgi:hypothetical protein